jgi:hypothetical protein
MATFVSRADGTIVVTVRITFKPGRDDTLIDMIVNAPKGALAGVIREAMRNGTANGAVEQAFEEVDTSGLGQDI